MELIMQFGPGGEIRAIHNDDTAPFLKAIGCGPPVRASHVEPIQAGPCAGLWHVDMSPLGEQYAYCLWPPFDRRDNALMAEHQHIEEVWIRNTDEKN